MTEEKVTDEEVQEREFDDAEILEHIRAHRSAHQVKVSDIVTMQCILCIILALLAIILNFLMPSFSEKIIDKYKAESFAAGEADEAWATVVSKITELMNTAPNDRV